MNKIFNIKNSSTEEKLGLGIILCILLVIFTFILKNFLYNKEIIDYKETNMESLYEYAITTNDRQIYWILNDIIETFVNSYYLELDNVKKEQVVYSREDFYNTLSDAYKKEITKNEYMEISNNILKKFVQKDGNMKSYDFIDEIRYLNDKVYPSNMYICKLNTNDENDSSFIGIWLEPSTKSYNIFYLE